MTKHLQNRRHNHKQKRYHMNSIEELIFNIIYSISFFVLFVVKNMNYLRNRQALITSEMCTSDKPEPVNLLQKVFIADAVSGKGCPIPTALPCSCAIFASFKS